MSVVFNFGQNKSPFAVALGDWFPLRTYFLTSKASPNDTVIIVIIVAIIVSEAKLVLHSDGIIAQRFFLDRADMKHPASAGNTIGAGVATENGAKAAVPGEMHCEDVDEDED